MLVRLFKPVIVYICAYINSRINKLEQRLVSDLNQIKQDLADLGASQSAEFAAVQAKIEQLKNNGGASPTDLDDLHSTITTLKSSVDSFTASLNDAAQAPAPGASAAAAPAA